MPKGEGLLPCSWESAYRLFPKALHGRKGTHAAATRLASFTEKLRGSKSPPAHLIANSRYRYAHRTQPALDIDAVDAVKDA